MKQRQPFRHRVVSFAAASGIALAFTLTGAGPAAAEPGICAVTAGTNGGYKFATLKCAKKSSPNNFVIRSTVWERKDKKGYRNLAGAAGRSFNCTLNRGGGSVLGPTTHTITYKISNCK